jgi:NhaP-type Na+/H+ or K+/H+ antiporter
MVDVLFVLLGAGIILFLGYVAEFLFKKTKIPDILILILIGFIIGPHILGYFDPKSIEEYAPIFTTFTLLFLLFDGGLNLSIKSIVEGAVKTFNMTIVNFLVSTILTGAIMLIAGYDIWLSLLTGVILGGICSAFVIPIIKQLKIKPDTASILTLESAITDVLSIVFAFAIMEIIILNSADFFSSLKTLLFLFLIAGVIGVVAGLIWIMAVTSIFKMNTPIMLTIAYVMLVYVLSEFLGGNGAIATLFVGITLKNSKQITRRILLMIHHDDKETEEIHGMMAVTHRESTFYEQISFFLKTFFFVYIGVLFNLDNIPALIIGFAISVAMLYGRKISQFVVSDYPEYDRQIAEVIFARGLAAAAIAQLLIANNIARSTEVAAIVYNVIIFTILFSAILIFLVNRGVFNKKKNSTRNIDIT